MLEVADQPVLRVWRRHEQRRRDGLPTVGLFVGTGAEVSKLAAVLGATGLTLLTSAADDAERIQRDWLTALSNRLDVLDEAFGFVAQALGVSERELRVAWSARSDVERMLWLDQRRNHAAPGLRAALDTLRSALDTNDAAAAELRSVLIWLPTRARIVLCLHARSTTGLQSLLNLASAYPDWTLLAHVESGAWARLRDELDDRGRARLDECLLPEIAAQTPPSSALQPTRSQPPSDVRARAAEAIVEARNARDSLAPEAEVLDQRARSLAEQRLFELLEADAVTTGLFKLNERLPFMFGQQPIEVDLLCTQLRLAVEVDGYHHFQAFDAYRRDRRKDVLLQQHGYLVSRCLASDVIERAGDIVRALRELVLQRRLKEGAS